MRVMKCKIVKIFHFHGKCEEFPPCSFIRSVIIVEEEHVGLNKINHWNK